MLCEKCNKNQATFHYAEVINGVRSEHHLCSECAANTDVSFYSSIFENDENFTRLISGILGGKAMTINNKAPPIIIMFLLLKETPSSFFPVTGVEAVSSGVVVSSSIISGDVVRNLCIVPSTVS